MKIRKRTYPETGTVRYELDLGMVDGVRKKKLFPTAAKAKKALKKALRAQERLGEMGHMLTGAEAAEFIHARQRLGGVPITTAVDFYLAHGNVVKEPVEMQALINRFIDHKEKIGRGERYNEVQSRLEAFALTVATKKAHEVEDPDVERWLHGNDWKPKTKNNYLSEVSAMFDFAVKRKHATKNPCDHIERAKLPDAEIEVVALADVEKMLNTALEPRHIRMLGYITVGFFCGIRPEEQQRVTWADVDLEAGTIIVRGVKAKSRKRRVVDISANALEWLKRVPAEHRQPHITLATSNFRDRRRALFHACGWTRTGSGGVKDWPHDGLRHTFASMHYAHHQNEALLQVQMGHVSKDELHRHYRAIVTKADAARFWALVPPVVADG